MPAEEQAEQECSAELVPERTEEQAGQEHSVELVPERTELQAVPEYSEKPELLQAELQGFPVQDPVKRQMQTVLRRRFPFLLFQCRFRQDMLQIQLQLPCRTDRVHLPVFLHAVILQ